MTPPSAAPVSLQPPPSADTEASVIESRIDGDFEGWTGETLFILTNGQLWQQREYAYYYAYRYSPRVVLFQGKGGWVMQVEGIDRTVRVKRLL